jgi:hypothetical protein
MPSRRAKKIRWLPDAQAHDYPAARSYLRLLYRDTEVATIVKRLKVTRPTEFKAKDIFRASRLSLLGVSNSHVAKDRIKIGAGERLSPLLLVRDGHNGKVIIADGYHRLCAVYTFDEDAWIPCKIV